MSWYCVQIPPRASSNVSAWALISMSREIHQKAGVPKHVAVYHEFTRDRHNLFYFSPESIPVFHHLLKFFGATAIETPPSLEGLTRVLGPLTPPAENW
jgi:hypothetical protein